MEEKTTQKPDFADWFSTDKSKGDQLAEQTEWNLTHLYDFELPDVNLDDFKIPEELLEALKQPPHKISIEELTERKFGGKGIFDAIQESVWNHLNKEMMEGRISGAEFVTIYSGNIPTALQTALNFLVQQDQIYWQSIAAQLGAINAAVAIAIAKAQLTQTLYKAHTARAEYALMKMKLATEQETCKRIREEMEATHAQTQGTRTDGLAVSGAIGSNIDLQTIQGKSYQDNLKIKTAQFYVDSYSVAKTVDEGLLPPSNFQNDSIDAVLDSVKDSVGI